MWTRSSVECLSSSSDGAAVAAADHQRALGIRMRHRRGMHEVLVIEELVALGGHDEAVEAEDAAELRRVVAPRAAGTASGGARRACPRNRRRAASFRRSKIFSAWGDVACGRRGRCRVRQRVLPRQVAAALHALDEDVGGLERLHQALVDRFRLGRCCRRCSCRRTHRASRRRARATCGSPGAIRRARPRPWCRPAGCRQPSNWIEVVAEDREAGVLCTPSTQSVAQLLRTRQELALPAVVQVGNDVQSLHRRYPFQAKIRSRGLHARPRAFRESGTPSDRGRRVQSFLQRFTQAKNIAVKKCASIIAYILLA